MPDNDPSQFCQFEESVPTVLIINRLVLIQTCPSFFSLSCGGSIFSIWKVCYWFNALDGSSSLLLFVGRPSPRVCFLTRENNPPHRKPPKFLFHSISIDDQSALVRKDVCLLWPPPRKFSSKPKRCSATVADVISWRLSSLKNHRSCPLCTSFALDEEPRKAQTKETLSSSISGDRW